MSDTTAGSRRGAIRVAGATIREDDLPTTSEVADVVGCTYRTAYARLNRLEDVLPPENMRAQREFVLSTDVPLATGENRFWVHEFTELIQEFSVDILIPDTSTCGGLAATKAIANHAEEQYIPISPHNVCSPIGTIANVHLGAAVPNFDVLEYHALDVEWWDDLLMRSEPLIQDGYIEVPEEPGLGVELDKDVAERHATGEGSMF